MEDNTQIQVGDPVRSFDFPDRGKDLEGDLACFVEGIVQGVEAFEGCERYIIKVSRRVFCGKEEPVKSDEQVCPPINGTPRIFGGNTCNGVEKL